MPKKCYVQKRFHGSSLLIIEQANEIIDEYRAQGYDLTLRQLYYQFVSRDIIPNNDREYNRLGSIVNDARLAGLIDWTAITDRTRNLRSVPHWDNPEQIIKSAASQFKLDKWLKQMYRPEVWIEKDALVGVIEGICAELDVPYFSCRGYTSQSEMWAAGQRMLRHRRNGQYPVIFHFGDHDPSGMDMTRDIDDRITMFAGSCDVRRIALNMYQIEEYNPPPNPAKLSDSRADKYISEYGDDSWELDALEPSVISSLIEQEILSLIDKEAWEDVQEQEKSAKQDLETVTANWTYIMEEWR